MKFLYNIFLWLYPLTAKLLSIKNNKAKQWIVGRKNIFESLANVFQHNNHSVVWVHCASLGEFEQCRPVIEQLKLSYPNIKILLTFFSPSGYEVRKNYEHANWVFYLPMDSKKNATSFLNIVQPSLVIFVKYEFWWYYLHACKQRNIATILISGHFRKQQIFFKWYGSFYRNILQQFTHLFIQNETSKQLLHSIGINANITCNGDTRFDRVVEIATQFLPIQYIEQFITTHKVIVAGSTWREDDEALNHFAYLQQQIKFIVAPHQINLERMQECLQLYHRSILYSDWIKLASKNESNNNYNVLIIDNVGLLSLLYNYANICFIGGGFTSSGIHNILEAAVYAKPVVFGPVYEKYQEAIDLIAINAAISVVNTLQLEEILGMLLNNSIAMYEMGKTAGDYVKNNCGATEVILNYIHENLLLTN